jgi:hypothetical protein
MSALAVGGGSHGPGNGAAHLRYLLRMLPDLAIRRLLHLGGLLLSTKTVNSVPYVPIHWRS